jgi:hypothetical protein
VRRNLLLAIALVCSPLLAQDDMTLTAPPKLDPYLGVSDTGHVVLEGDATAWSDERAPD